MFEAFVLLVSPAYASGSQLCQRSVCSDQPCVLSSTLSVVREAYSSSVPDVHFISVADTITASLYISHTNNGPIKKIYNIKRMSKLECRQTSKQAIKK